MESFLVRLKPYDERRGYVLRRYSFIGIKFHEDRGWYRVEKQIADRLKNVHQIPNDIHSPLAFDVCTEEEAKELDAKEKADALRKEAKDDIQLSKARSNETVITSDLPESNKKGKRN